MRTIWMVCLVCIIAIGILSRVLHTGFILFDKYLGDALYAVMVYIILRLAMWKKNAPVAIPALIVMLAIELFQLSGIPAQLAASEPLILRICGRLLGTHFSFLDLLAYALGISCIYVVDGRFLPKPVASSNA